MEPTQITTPPPHTSINTTVTGGSNRFQNLSPKNILLFLIIIIFVIGGVFYGVTKVKNNTSSKKEDVAQDNREIVNLAPYTLVYGSWTDKSSVILAYDLSTGREGVLAELPVNIKKVTVLDNNTLLYIAQTDVRDHGRVIAKYDLSKKQETTLLTASEGFGIDDYVLSPDKKYISLWEVQTDNESEVLLNGKSRVYTANIGQPNIKNLIYDEISAIESPIHYPRAILNTGTVFLDKFVPNFGAGWAYGMSMSNFTGTEQKDIDNMSNGTYGTQPVLSPDGRYLVFAGYDGSEGPGQLFTNGFRNAITYTNTIETLNTSTLERQKLEIFKSDNLYTSPYWDLQGNILVNILKGESLDRSLYSYDLNTTQITKIGYFFDKEQIPLSVFNSQKLIIGKIYNTPSSIGNLGDRYSAPYISLSVYNTSDKKEVPLNVSKTLIQYIGILPSSKYFGKLTTQTTNQNQLQLDTFHINPTLAPKRNTQQSSPKTERQSNATISEGETTKNIDCQHNTNPCNLPVCKTGATAKCGDLNTSLPVDEFQEVRTCHHDYESESISNGSCWDSPLYLYTPIQQKINIKIHTPIYNANISQANGEFSVLTQSDGSMTIENKRVEGITFSYTPAIRKIPAPKFGYIINKNNLQITLQKIGEKLNLNKKEIDDLIMSVQSITTGKYIYVSFFDHETSHAILPITFNPKPDVYRNIVFYFKNLDQKPNFSIQPPTFDPIDRHGFTAIEISEIAE